MAQAGGALLLTEIPDRDNKLMVFTGIERAKFRRPVVPGDQLRIEIKVLQWKTRAVRLEGQGDGGRQAGLRGDGDVQLVPRRGRRGGALLSRRSACDGCGDGRVSIHPTAIVAAGAVVPESCDGWALIARLVRMLCWARSASWFRMWCWMGG